MDKILSIVIPTYNMEKYLRNCLDSFICENKDLIEVLVVNDGSKDGSLNIAKEYETKYPDVFKVIDKENGGHGSTINAGLKIAKGKYFKVVDSDDWVNVENLDKLIMKLKVIESDAVCTNFRRIYEDSNTSEIDECCSGMSGLYEINNVQNPSVFLMHSMTYKTDKIKDVQLLERCFYVDVLYNIYCYSRCDSVFFVPNIDVYQYRLGRAGQSVSIDGLYKHRAEHEKVIKTAIEYIETIRDEYKKQLLIEYLKGVVCSHYFIYIETYKKHKEALNEIIEFDKWLKGFDTFYGITNSGVIKKFREGEFKNIRSVRMLLFARKIWKKLFGK